VSKKSHIIDLTPTLDKFGVLRIRGRGSAANTTMEFKHPIILPKHNLTKALIHDAHLKNLHGETQLVMNHLRTKYWIIGARALINATINSLSQCYISPTYIFCKINFLTQCKRTFSAHTMQKSVSSYELYFQSYRQKTKKLYH
jgi:hypothetical protein